MAVPLAAAAVSGCLYTNVHAPRAWRSATPADVKAEAGDPAVTGKACNRAALWLVAWGDASYRAAVRDALKDRPDAILYDAKADVEVRSYLLGLYARNCTVVSGRVGRP